MQTLKCFLIFLLSALWQLSYAQADFSSVQEVLDFETAQIAALGSADSYINRAESYLLCQDYDLALNDLEVGYQLSQDIEDNPTLNFRSLFGLAIVYANIDQLDKFYAVVNSIEEFLNTHICTGCSEKQHSVGLCSYVLEKTLTADQPILGPDRISIEECIERAQTTANCAKIIIGFSKLRVQFILNSLVNDLEDRAIRCCMAGGLWKACLQPLVNKWHRWNEKWKVFGIPPDPAWD